MNFFLAKTDPDSYSIGDFEKDGTTLWDGVHSYAAINFIKQMKPGDQVYIYESQGPKAIVGLSEVVDSPFENKADPRFSWAVKLKFVRRVPTLTLDDMKSEPNLKDFALIKQGRLSTMAVPNNIAQWINQRLGL